MQSDSTPRATEGDSAEDDFAAFLGALDDMGEKKDEAKDDAEEGDGLDDLPVVEIKRRLRSAGAAIPGGLEDKDELVALLRETLNKPKGDAFMDFLSEIDKIHPGADVEMKEPPEDAFADFLKEIDGMPAEVPEKPVVRPLRLRYDTESRRWVVAVTEGVEEEFPAEAGPVEARRKAVEFCCQKLKELESQADQLENEKEKAEIVKLSERVKAAFPEELQKRREKSQKLGICRGLEFPSMQLLIQYGNGKGTFQWPVKVRQSFPGSRTTAQAPYTAEVEQKFEIHRPVHPFQLSWRVCLDKRDATGSFGIGNFRNPAGLVVSCPSKSAFQKLQKHQAKHAMEAAVMQRKLQQEQQQRLALLLAEASEEEAKAINQRVAAETKAALAESARAAEHSLYTRWARRLERLAVFSSAQGREDNRSLVQLEGLTVLPNEDGSNALPVLLLLAFFRPRSCGASTQGGCAALCDLDSQEVRAVSMFGHAEESRWVLPITGKRKLNLEDLKHVNELRQAVSAAFEVDDGEEAKDTKERSKRRTQPKGSRVVIKENTETTRALGLLLGSVGLPKVPFEEEESKEQAEGEASKRFLGDVWIDLGEDGVDDDSAAWEQDHLFVRWDAPLPGGSASPVFLSFEDLGSPGKEPERGSPEPEAPKADATSTPSETQRFSFLPELSLGQALKDRAESFKLMQAEAERLGVRKLRRMAKFVDTFKEKSTSAWNLAMKAEEPMGVKQAMNLATRIMQDLGASYAEVEAGASFVQELHQQSDSRLQRAESCNKSAPHIWASAIKAARLIHEKLAFQWKLASTILNHSTNSKRVSYKKADETVRLVNEKLLRWKEEAEILQQEAREDELARQASLRGMRLPKVEAERAEMARRQELERQRAQAIQWGRHLVQPMPHMAPPPADGSMTSPPGPPDA
ncbi:unnamed protein product [Effrenium voratum]|nr:unnamed protein product [Effrenium voratum]